MNFDNLASIVSGSNIRLSHGKKPMKKSNFPLEKRALRNEGRLLHCFRHTLLGGGCTGGAGANYHRAKMLPLCAWEGGGGERGWSAHKSMHRLNYQRTEILLLGCGRLITTLRVRESRRDGRVGLQLVDTPVNLHTINNTRTQVPIYHKYVRFGKTNKFTQSKQLH